MTDKPRDMGDYQTAVDAYVTHGYSKEGAEAAIDTHCAIVARHTKTIPVAPPPEPVAEPKSAVEDEFEQKEAEKQEDAQTADSTEDAKEEVPA